MKPWPHTIEPEQTKIGWRWLVRKVFTDPAGSEQEYYTMERLGTIHVATIALTVDNTVLVAEQFRPGPEKIFEELPGGGHDSGEEPEAAARRELHEETGYTPGSMEHLGVIYKDGYSNAETHYFLARDCVKDAEQHTDDGEFINVKEISIKQLLDNAYGARMSDVGWVFLAYDKLRELEG